MKKNLDTLSLLKGDRLEPSSDLIDVGAFESLPLPTTVVFWRVKNTTMTLHRNPIFSRALGCTISTIALDMLHILHLGIYKLYCRTVIWLLILGNAYDVDYTGREALVELSVRALKVRLHQWYKAEKLRCPGQPLYEIQELTPAMLGSNEKRTLATKGAETGTLLFFCREEAARHMRKLGAAGTHVVKLGNSLCDMLEILRSSPRVMTPEQRKALVATAKSAFELRERATVPFVPKWHLVLHLAARAGFSGNPNFHNTFVDEHWNGELKKSAQGCSRLTWYHRVITAFRYRLAQFRKRMRF